MSEFKILEIQVYRDPEGVPTCAADFPSSQVCEYYCTRRFGVDETCMLDLDYRLLKRRKDGIGHLIPGKWCPLWKHHYSVENQDRPILYSTEFTFEDLVSILGVDFAEVAALTAEDRHRVTFMVNRGLYETAAGIMSLMLIPVEKCRACPASVQYALDLEFKRMRTYK